MDDLDWHEAWCRGFNEGCMERNEGLGAGCACVLVRDESLGSRDAPFVQWLRSQGFTFGKPAKGWYPGEVVLYVNFYSKTYGPGMPGIRLVSFMGGHTITIDEFMTIYNIFDHYRQDLKPKDTRSDDRLQSSPEGPTES